MDAGILKDEFQIGMLNEDDVAWYVRNHGINASDFKYITGSDYVTENATKE